MFNSIFSLTRNWARHQGTRTGHTLQATELVDQIYLRLVGAKDRGWHNRQHFFAIAGRAMRRYLIDDARARPDVDRLLDQLEEAKPEWRLLVEVKYFQGLTGVEAAEALG